MTELDFVQYLNQLGQGTFVDNVTIFISKIPFLIVLWVILAIITSLTNKRYRWYVFLTIVIAIALHFIISEGIFKHGLLTFFDMRMRPWRIIGSDITPLGTQFMDSSFPSSHMASTTAALTVFVIYYRKMLVPALIFLLLMAFARMHNGMHFPSDVLAGTILGLIYGTLAYRMVKSIQSNRNETKIDTAQISKQPQVV